MSEEKMELFCETCHKQLPAAGHYEISIFREGRAVATWSFDTVGCIEEFAATYKHLDDAIAADDERDKEP